MVEENIKKLLTNLDLWQRRDDSIGEFSKVVSLIKALISLKFDFIVRKIL
jgi:hypothetical protein